MIRNSTSFESVFCERIIGSDPMLAQGIRI